MKDKVKIEKSKVSILDSIKKSFHTKKFRFDYCNCYYSYYKYYYYRIKYKSRC